MRGFHVGHGVVAFRYDGSLEGGVELTRWMAKKVRALSLCMLVALLLGACASIGGLLPAAKVQSAGDLVMGLNAEPQTLDPATAFMEQEATVMRQVYDTLVYVDAKYQLHAGLATSWEQSADAKTFTLKLRQGVKFHDGVPFDAKAAKFNFDRFGNPDVATGSVSTYWTDYVSTEIVDNYQVRVGFGSAHPLFLTALGYGIMGMASPKAVEAGGADYGTQPVGTGPFIFDKWALGESITLKANADYKWAPDIFTHQGAPYLATVTFRFVPEDTTRIAMLQSGEASVVEQFPAQDIAWLQKDAGYYLVSGTAPGLPTVMMINVEKAPTNDLAVRQALIYAIDQEALVKAAYFDTQKAAHGVLASNTLGYDAKAGEMYRYDPVKAADILTKAGWVDTNGDKIREKNGNSLKIHYPAYRVWESSYMELLQNYWSAVGISVDLEQLEDAAAWDAAAKGEHNVTNMGSISFDASVLWPSFHSSNVAQGYAFTRYTDAELDATLDKALVEVDPKLRNELYAGAQRKIMEQALVVPVYYFTRILAVKAKFAGVTLDWQNWYPYFYDVSVKP